MTEPDPTIAPSPAASPRINAIVAWLLGPLFIALAAWLYLGPRRVVLPLAPPAVIAAGQLSTAPLRTPLGDPPMAVINGFRRDCMDCHRLFKTAKPQSHGLIQHRDIVLRHGLNDRCLNCHHPDDRNKLVLNDGRAIGFDQVPRLCARCHGTTWRDWQRGMHGKTLGYWDTSAGTARRLVCTHCHDPHAPAFNPFVPLPPPHTLRMGDQSVRPDDHPAHNPLRTWSGVDAQRIDPHPQPACPTATVPVPVQSPQDATS